MNIFGVGTWEMLVIIVGALIIFGPGKLPEVMGQAGRMVRDFRRMTADLTGEFEKAVGDPNEIKRALTGEIDSVKSQVAGTASTVKRDLNQVSTTVGKTVSGTAKSGTTSKGGSTTTRSGTTSRTATGATTGSAKKAASTSTTAGSKTTATTKPATPAVASKADPLADVFLLEPDSEPAPASAAKAPINGNPGANGATRSATAPRPTNGRVTISGGDDPLARARQRRQSAGYGAGRQT